MSASSGKQMFGVIVCDSQAKWGGAEGITQRVKYLMAKDGDEWKTFLAEQGELPTEEDLQIFQGFYITGSKHSVNDDTQPWIQKLESFIQQAYHLKRPNVFGTCFGHQAIGKALGGKVTKNPDKKFVCSNEKIVLSEESTSDSSFLKDVKKINETKPLRLLKAHGECVSELPKNAESIASSESCINEIVLYSENIVGIQSHPDFFAEDLSDIIIPSLIEREIITKEEFDEASESLELSNSCGDVAKAIRDFLSCKN